MNAQETARYICEALLERKGKEIDVLHVEHLTSLTEYFVICTATSTTQVKALADSVEYHLKYDHDITPHHTRGTQVLQSGEPVEGWHADFAQGAGCAGRGSSVIYFRFCSGRYG